MSSYDLVIPEIDAPGGLIDSMNNHHHGDRRVLEALEKTQNIIWLAADGVEPPALEEIRVRRKQAPHGFPRMSSLAYDGYALKCGVPAKSMNGLWGRVDVAHIKRSVPIGRLQRLAMEHYSLPVLTPQ